MTDSFQQFVLEQLAAMPNLECRRMFGGHGLYDADGVFFAILYDGRVYFKVNDESRGEYETLGMKPFQPSEKQTLKTYYEVPVDVLEDAHEMVDWAQRAVKAAAGEKKKMKK